MATQLERAQVWTIQNPGRDLPLSLSAKSLFSGSLTEFETWRDRYNRNIQLVRAGIGDATNIDHWRQLQEGKQFMPVERSFLDAPDGKLVYRLPTLYTPSWEDSLVQVFDMFSQTVHGGKSDSRTVRRATNVLGVVTDAENGATVTTRFTKDMVVDVRRRSKWPVERSDSLEFTIRPYTLAEEIKDKLSFHGTAAAIKEVQATNYHAHRATVLFHSHEVDISYVDMVNGLRLTGYTTTTPAERDYIRREYAHVWDSLKQQEIFLGRDNRIISLLDISPGSVNVWIPRSEVQQQREVFVDRIAPLVGAKVLTFLDKVQSMRGGDLSPRTIIEEAVGEFAHTPQGMTVRNASVNQVVRDCYPAVVAGLSSHVPEEIHRILYSLVRALTGITSSHTIVNDQYVIGFPQEGEPALKEWHIWWSEAHHEYKLDVNMK